MERIQGELCFMVGANSWTDETAFQCSPSSGGIAPAEKFAFSLDIPIDLYDTLLLGLGT
ncbi:hypothetical protein ACFFV7_40630 [Nonomuraea spiralis]|uniref:Uncharacterized protein n=1 Tax=Nonomuraea spiralis TaxID=46182 RepID=A0ABV5ISN2_9ACTN|nr:hypothetical protein [Nonomuraea spiralis]GGT44103.1 hypothetical protein GCM10010176_104390 [Nonomuraea spiralis]